MDDKDAGRKKELMDIQRKLIYDMAIMYDLWFNDEKRAKEANDEDSEGSTEKEEGQDGE